MSNVMAHVMDVEAFMFEIKRVIKPGGRIFILQSNRYGWWKFWGYFILRNDRASHLRTFDLWGMKTLLASNYFETERFFAPYHFYLQAKNWNLLYWVDRWLEGRVPNALATTWIVVARRSESEVPRPGLMSKWPLPFVVLVTPFHVFALKALDIGIRVVLKVTRRPESGEELT